MSMEWMVEEVAADVGTLHSLGPPDSGKRTLRWCIPTSGAVVLGSTQPRSDVDQPVAAELGLDVVRRRSGGGAVLVEPGDTTWVDVFLPKGDPLWSDDVGKAFAWVGRAWADWLSVTGAEAALTYEGPMITTPWSRKICFAGLGPGEVCIQGSKVVGMSQRRTREGALFQCSIYRHFRSERLVSVLNLEPAEKEEALTALNQSVAAFQYSEPELRNGLQSLFETL